MPSEQIRTHLISMYCVLSKAATSVVGPSPTTGEKELKAKIAALYHQNKVSVVFVFCVLAWFVT